MPDFHVCPKRAVPAHMRIRFLIASPFPRLAMLLPFSTQLGRAGQDTLNTIIFWSR
jgi:hypothetical protein